jgi:hypothetical protein
MSCRSWRRLGEALASTTVLPPSSAFSGPNIAFRACSRNHPKHPRVVADCVQGMTGVWVDRCLGVLRGGEYVSGDCGESVGVMVLHHLPLFIRLALSAH